MARSTHTGPRTDTVLGVACVVVSLVLLLLPDRVQVQVAHVLSTVIVNPWHEARNFAQDVLWVRAENARLAAEVDALEARLASVRREHADLERYAAPALPDGFIGPAAPCYVVARERARLATMIQVRSIDPLRWSPELPVVTGDGLIGRIHTVIDAHAAWVELLSAPDLALGVEFVRTGVVGVLRPRAGRFVVELVGRDEDVLPGDRVVTSGIAEVRDTVDAEPHDPVPRGLPVGEVTQVSAPSDQVFKEIEVRPLAGFRRNETVFVVGAESLAPPSRLQRPDGDVDMDAGAGAAHGGAAEGRP
jgi:hypothetical protein